MSSRPRHPDKDIEAAIQHLETLGWTYRNVGKSSHAWGRMLCPQHDSTGCQVSVWSTPKVPAMHARQLMGHGKRCAHVKKEAGDDDV